jgi:hypothetical protein
MSLRQASPTPVSPLWAFGLAGPYMALVLTSALFFPRLQFLQKSWLVLLMAFIFSPGKRYLLPELVSPGQLSPQVSANFGKQIFHRRE